MKRSRPFIYALALAITVALGCISLFGQPVRTVVPKSEKKISLTITLPDGNWVKSREPEGGMVRIEREGKTWGISSTVKDESKGSVAVKVFQITRTDDGGEAVREVENKRVGMASARTMDTDGFSIQVTRIERVPPGSDSSLTGEPGDVPIDEPGEGIGKCCVTCNGWKVCGCKVEMSCGSCCSDACCT